MANNMTKALDTLVQFFNENRQFGFGGWHFTKSGRISLTYYECDESGNDIKRRILLDVKED